MQEVVHFYLPWHRDGVDRLPVRPEDYWSWIVPRRNIGEGKYSWTLQTFLYLREAGVPCVLAETFPSHGIVISHRDFLPVILPSNADVFLVCIKPDRKEHTWAQHYMVQNEHDPAFVLFSPACVSQMKFWPQPSLRPRDPSRGARCENVGYFGRMVNLAPELRDPCWHRELEDVGFRWLTPNMEHWNDYRSIDVTVSVRAFGLKRNDTDAVFDPNSKPPTKLTNSWLAGVPSIVGNESSYTSIKSSALDFIGVDSKDALKQALIGLRDDRILYERMQAHGQRRAMEFSAEAVVERWQDVLATSIRPASTAWMRLPRWRRNLRNVGRFAKYFSRSRNIADIIVTIAGKVSKPTQ